MYLTNISPIYHKNQGHIWVIWIREKSENPESPSTPTLSQRLEQAYEDMQHLQTTIRSIQEEIRRQPSGSSSLSPQPSPAPPEQSGVGDNTTTF